ncbi:MAG: hypothetical protein ACWA44_15520 [Thiotrichales bacterium]
MRSTLHETPVQDIIRVSPNLLLTLSAVTITAILTGGLITLPHHGSNDIAWRLFDLDRELNLVVLFSSLLLLGNALMVAKLIQQNYLSRGSFLLAAIFLFMALDEMLIIHETLEISLATDWQIIYLPIMLLAGLGWVQVLARSSGIVRVSWFLGAAAWALSQLLEQWQWIDSPGGSIEAIHYNVMMVSEELLEMIGSTLFLYALFRWMWPGGALIRAPILAHRRIMQH